MAYSSPNLKLIAGTTWDRGAMRIWSYKSDDAMSTVRGENYIADARLRGMAPGDVIYVTQTTAGAITAITQSVVLTVGASGADISDGSAITVTNT
jgi:hypothetical protein